MEKKSETDRNLNSDVEDRAMKISEEKKTSETDRDLNSDVEDQALKISEEKKTSETDRPHTWPYKKRRSPEAASPSKYQRTYKSSLSRKLEFEALPTSAPSRRLGVGDLKNKQRREIVHPESQVDLSLQAKLSAAKEKFGRKIRIFETDVLHEFTANDTKKEDEFLRTRKIREAEQAGCRSRITKAVIRVCFPDNTTLEATFHPSETIQSLVDLLMRVVARPELSFHIYTTPPKKLIKDMTLDFYSAGFAPGANVYFSYDIPKGDNVADVNSGPFLHEDIMALKGLELLKEHTEPVQSATGNDTKDMSLSPVDFLLPGQPPEAPHIILYPLTAPPGEECMVRREKLFLFNGFPSAKPRIMHVFTDGNYEVETTTPPCTTYRLELVGHSKGLVCFKNPALKEICVWDLETISARKMIEDVETSAGEIFSYGFGHKISGSFMVVRVGHPHQPMKKHKYCECYIDTSVEGREKWIRSGIEDRFHFAKAPAMFVQRDHSFYWKATTEEGTYIFTYNLETKRMGLLTAPVDLVGDLTLGHGFKGQLAAASYVPPSQGFSHLHIWVLMFGEHWQRLLDFPLTKYSVDEQFVPLLFYYDYKDGAINLVVSRGMVEILRITPARSSVTLLDTTFQRVSISSAIPMEVASWREFQATPLGSFRSNKTIVDHKTINDKKIKLCCQDDDPYLLLSLLLNEFDGNPCGRHCEVGSHE